MVELALGLQRIKSVLTRESVLGPKSKFRLDSR